MKKTLVLVLAVMLSLTLAGLVSATAYPANSALIAGKIYQNNYADIVSGATVNVTCGTKTISTTSLSDGAYVAKFSTISDNCDIGANVTVYAEKIGVGSNSATGVINDGSGLNLDINFGVVNVNLIPEFSLIVGAITIMGAMIAFFVIRRK
jgi:hypothetical protein